MVIEAIFRMPAMQRQIKHSSQLISHFINFRPLIWCSVPYWCRVSKIRSDSFANEIWIPWKRWTSWPLMGAHWVLIVCFSLFLCFPFENVNDTAEMHFLIMCNMQRRLTLHDWRLFYLDQLKSYDFVIICMDFNLVLLCWRCTLHIFHRYYNVDYIIVLRRPFCSLFVKINCSFFFSFFAIKEMKSMRRPILVIPTYPPHIWKF